MIKIVNSFILVVLTLALLVGCASIISKSNYPVTISSEPKGTDITIVNRSGEGVFSGATPTTVTLKAGAGFFRGEDYTVTFKKKGYATHTAQIQRGVDGWYIFGNFVLGGLIGWLIVDPATGAMWTLENLHSDLKPQPQTSSLQVDPLTGAMRTLKDLYAGAMWTLENLYAYLKPQTSSLQEEGIHIVTLDDVPRHLRSKMVKLN